MSIQTDCQRIIDLDNAANHEINPHTQHLAVREYEEFAAAFAPRAARALQLAVEVLEANAKYWESQPDSNGNTRKAMDLIAEEFGGLKP